MILNKILKYNVVKGQRLTLCIVFIFALLIINSGCQKEKEKLVTEYVEKQYSWKEHEGINNRQKYITNAHAGPDYLYLIGGRYITTIDKNDVVEGGIGTSDIRHSKLALCDDMYFNIFEENNTLASTGFLEFVYTPTYKDNFGASREIILLADIDTSFYEFQKFDFSFNIPLGGFNSNDQFLIPYRRRSIQDTAYFLLVTFNKHPQNLDNYLSVNDKKVIVMPLENINGTFHVFPVKDKFFVSNGEDVAMIYSDGSYRKIDVRALTADRAFKVGEVLYTTSWSKLYVSYDYGETWNEMYGSSGVLDNFTYAVIDNRVVFYYEDHMHELIFTETGFTSKQIKNDGLAGNYITSIQDFNGKIFVSTLSGLFYKDKSTFFEYKEEE